MWPSNDPSATEAKRFNALQLVCFVIAGAVVIASGLVVAGVGLLFGLGWALVAGGCLLGVSAVAAGYVLLRDPVSKVSDGQVA